MEGLQITGTTTTKKAQRYVMTSAIEAGHTHGIGYWAVVKGVKRSKDGLIRSILLIDCGDEAETPKSKRYLLVGSDIDRAVNKMLRDPEGTESQGWASRLLLDDSVDGPLADAIIQVACFGKVTYA